MCSTTGMGDVPDNMKSFWKFLLRKKHANNMLQGMTMSVFGLGDSSYPQFNVAARRLGQRLEGLGAKWLVERALGDYQDVNGCCVLIEF